MQSHVRAEWQQLLRRQRERTVLGVVVGVVERDDGVETVEPAEEADEHQNPVGGPDGCRPRTVSSASGQEVRRAEQRACARTHPHQLQEAPAVEGVRGGIVVSGQHVSPYAACISGHVIAITNRFVLSHHEPHGLAARSSMQYCTIADRVVSLSDSPNMRATSSTVSAGVRPAATSCPSFSRRRQVTPCATSARAENRPVFTQ